MTLIVLMTLIVVAVVITWVTLCNRYANKVTQWVSSVFHKFTGGNDNE